MPPTAGMGECFAHCVTGARRGGVRRAFGRLAAAALMTAAFSFSAGGQQPATGRGDVPSPTTVALIRSEAFYDPAGGITRLVQAAKVLEEEFRPRLSELEGMQKRIEQLSAEGGGAGADPNKLRDVSDQVEQLRRDFEYKEGSVRAEFSKRSGDVLGPILDDLNKTLDSFARGRGIMMILDPRKLEGAILYAGEGTDLTESFIADYNRRNPARSSATPRR